MAESSTQQQHEVNNCGFCLQKATYMEQPKQLPCSHVFCLPCLQGDAKKECPVCARIGQWKAYDSEWTDYEISKEGDKENTETQNTDHIKCDVCSTEKAVCLCVTCEQKLCDQHFKLHEQSNLFFTTKHEQIDVSVYMLTPARYNPRHCNIHSEKRLTSGCYACHQVFCEGCEPKKARCPKKHYSKPDKYHNISLASEMGDSIRHRLQDHIQVIADRVNKGLTLEKKAWSSLDEAETDVRNKMTEIDEAVQQAIASIQEMADKLRNELTAYLQRCKTEVEDHSLKVRELRERFENSQAVMSQRLVSQHDTEVITEYHDMEADIESVLKEDYQPVLPLGNIILSKSDTSFQGPESQSADSSAAFPLSLKEPDLIEISLKDNITKEGELCYTVTWSGKSLFYNMGECVLKRNDADESESEAGVTGRIYCIRPAGNFGLAFLIQKRKRREVMMGGTKSLIGKDHWWKHNTYGNDTMVCEYEQESNNLSHLSLNSKYVAICDVDNKEVKVFSYDGEHKISIGSGHLGCPIGVLLLNNSVLISDLTSGILYKYKLISNSDPVWKCLNLLRPTGICMDSKGYIYVASNSGKLIYFISPQGILIKRLTCDELQKTKSVHDITLSDDDETLALACREEGVKLFSIKTRTH